LVPSRVRALNVLKRDTDRFTKPPLAHSKHMAVAMIYPEPYDRKSTG
jgi:hypothetical protein